MLQITLRCHGCNLVRYLSNDKTLVVQHFREPYSWLSCHMVPERANELERVVFICLFLVEGPPVYTLTHPYTTLTHLVVMSDRIHFDIYIVLTISGWDRSAIVS